MVHFMAFGYNRPWSWKPSLPNSSATSVILRRAAGTDRGQGCDERSVSERSMMDEGEPGEAMSFEIGENVGPYRILERLGQGGMATVYVAYHPALDRRVAIKVLHPAFKEDPNFLERFRREARVVARLEHPNIVPIYDFAEHDGQPYLVMKFIEGETMKARLLRGPLTKEEGLTIMDAVGQGLSYAHGRGVLHRDIN